MPIICGKAVRKEVPVFNMQPMPQQFCGVPIERDVPMRTLTTFRLGGPADFVLRAQEEDQVLFACRAARELNIPVYAIGNGSNLIVRDGGLRGLVIVIGERMASVKREGTLLTAGAGIPLTDLAWEAVRLGLGGLEWACGIPGTLGGACAMNAGAYGGEMKQVLKSVRYLEDGHIFEKGISDAEMGYRTSAYCAPERIVLSATLMLVPDDGGAKDRQEDYLARRREKQPLEYPSAGSVFKRPPGCFAGALIESAGLKGLRVGGAEVSVKHAGFIVNTGAATAGDVLQLIEQVKERVWKAHGVELHCEPKIWGDD